MNRLTDIYNAVSVLHRIPLGGEDLNRYSGSPRLIRAAGDEPFDTVADGAAVIEHPEPGEVVWRDDAGVTRRRWNWRQARRTALTEDTTAALFILDALDPLTDEALTAAADELVEHIVRLGPDVRVARRCLRSPTPRHDAPTVGEVRTAMQASHRRGVVADPVLDDALARIAQLSARLHAVADLHGPRRTLLGTRVCSACTKPFPCPTSRAVQPAGTSHAAP